MNKLDWIAVDWGTSSLRAWGIDAAGKVLWEETSDKGMGGLEPAEFEPIFLDLIAAHVAGLERIEAIACGMVGARQGWVEASYRAVPCLPLDVAEMKQAPTRDPRLRFRIIGGLSQQKPADVIRGEETQIAGFQAQNPAFDGVLCLPGTHTKWVQLSAREVVSFQTCMTGDLFAAISGHTVLRHSVNTTDWDAEAFAAAVDEAVSHPERLAARLFSLRAEGLLGDLPAGAARARLSGFLIGAELAATRPYWLGQAVAIIGAGGLSRNYATALELLGVAAIVAKGDTMVLTGLTAARALDKGKIA
ncbi:MAG: 2-dehydro-3-deoxygalactonokinase [Tropicimonas sp.]|uniref:2-dehydro-3-deoxygalactonokinase n=1 Tax=Tropicimonas sp. TaxID=2067044 RepID=UPI003A8B15B8